MTDVDEILEGWRLSIEALEYAIVCIVMDGGLTEAEFLMEEAQAARKAFAKAEAASSRACPSASPSPRPRD
jgi:hypothetical protein